MWEPFCGLIFKPDIEIPAGRLQIRYTISTAASTASGTSGTSGSGGSGGASVACGE